MDVGLKDEGDGGAFGMRGEGGWRRGRCSADLCFDWLMPVTSGSPHRLSRRSPSREDDDTVLFFFLLFAVCCDLPVCGA